MNQKNYEKDQIENLKKVFSAEGQEHEEKLKLMKLEQDAAAKQQNSAAKARKQVMRPENANIVGGEHLANILPNQYDNHQNKFIVETRERLERYKVFNLRDITSEGYSLKYVKIDPEDV